MIFTTLASSSLDGPACAKMSTARETAAYFSDFGSPVWGFAWAGGFGLGGAWAGVWGLVTKWLVILGK